MPDLITVAMNLAKTWLHGNRKAPLGQEGPPNWNHARDVATRLAAYADHLPSGEADAWIAVAWMHDLLEDGRHSDWPEDRTLTNAELLSLLNAENVPQARAAHLVEMVEFLTKRDDPPHKGYFNRMKRDAPWPVLLIKALDRLGNLTDGRDAFDADKWEEYTSEAATWVVPLLVRVPEPTQTEVGAALQRAMN